jgi:hypothetical protein
MHRVEEKRSIHAPRLSTFIDDKSSARLETSHHNGIVEVARSIRVGSIFQCFQGVGPMETIPKPAELSETQLRLCRAIVSLKKLEQALRDCLHADIDFDATQEIEHALMDLCGVPAEYGEFDPDEHSDFLVRDMWSGELDEILTPDAKEKDFKRAIARMKELNDVESITFGPSGTKFELRRGEKDPH